MGKFNQGILGGFTGKVGNVVGYRSRGEWLYRQYQGIVSNPKTTKQVENRNEFAKFAQDLKTVCKSDLNQIIGKKFAGGNTYFSFMMASTLAAKKYYETEQKSKNKGTTISVPHETNIGSIGLITHSSTPAGLAGLLSFDNRGASADAMKNFFGLRVPYNFYAGFTTNQIALNFLAMGYDTNKRPFVSYYKLPLAEILEVTENKLNPACGLQLTAEATNAQYVFEITNAATSTFKGLVGNNKPLLREAGKGICYLLVSDSLGSILYSDYKEILPSE